ncbi:carboxyl transferase [Parahaliea sp. F7430]|uniref:Carboxyl transferase n=1 Tax=Sediminihaliea albiluteola TaxID=2758564 RepID=A0A7W2YIU2_9GAMM|nr:carboxyl transferase domain-containing protein [Sediminihaliea albiluteola]MBA6411904.1 carboxyl transferase [Sediminihaliea albiluteola]
MVDNRTAWQALLGQLHERQTSAQSMGGEERIARQHQRQRLTARERIEQLCDPDSFTEYGALAGGCHPAGAASVPADALVAGIGRIDGASAVILAEDFTVKGGSIGHPNAAKRARMVRLALEQKLPLVLLLDGAGERASNQSERYPHAPGDLQLVADLKGQVPVVTVVMGSSAGHGALTGMFADLIIMSRNASMFSAGPPLVAAALGQELSPEQLGSASMHCATSGVGHNMADSDEDCLSLARRFLSYLPKRAGDPLPIDANASEAAAREIDDLLDIIPPAPQLSYNMHAVLERTVDSGSLLELQPLYGSNIITALARIGGMPCLILANQPAVQAGAITTEAADKASHFLEVAAAFGLPLVSLVDNPGVMPGPASEKAGVLKAAGRMFRAQRACRSKKVVVTLRKAFGFGSSVMGMNPFDHQVASLALPCVSLGGVPALGGAAASGADQAEAQQMESLQAGAWIPADAMAFDRVIDPRQLRNEIIAALYAS